MFSISENFILQKKNRAYFKKVFRKINSFNRKVLCVQNLGAKRINIQSVSTQKICICSE